MDITAIKRNNMFGPQQESIIQPKPLKKKSKRGRVDLEKLKNSGYKKAEGLEMPLDEHWLIKPRHFNIYLGHDNTGKSYFTLFLVAASALKRKWRWTIYMGENEISYAFASLAQMYKDKHLSDFTDEDLNEAADWVEERFTFIDNDEPATYHDIISFCKANPADGILIDPYNSLIRDGNLLKKLGSTHEYDYHAASSFRSLSRTENMCVWVSMHAVTEAGRKLYPKGHEFEGYQIPPSKVDVEGGGKWANRADDFLIIHRLLGHPDYHTRTEVHVRKIKYTETGGRVTPIDSPVHFHWNGYGFNDEYGFNPFKKLTKILDAPF